MKEFLAKALALIIICVPILILSVFLSEWSNGMKRRDCEQSGGQYLENRFKSELSQCFYARQ